VSLAGDVAAGDIVINGQNLPAIDISNHEISDVVGIINANITGVTASAFNKVIMGDVGTGITSAGQVSIGVQSIESQFDDPNQAADSGDTGDLEYQSFKIDEATTSLTELAAKITEKTGGLVTASVNTDGKLVLENDTGAGIHVMDTSNNAGATGLTTADADKGSNATERNNNPDYDPTDNSDPNDSREFFGYIKLTSTTNDPITIDIGNKGDDAAGTTAELEQLGFSRVNVSDDVDSKYSIIGASYDATDSTDVLEVGDIVINGVDVYNSNITTDTVAGKLNAINAVADQTGVTANTFFEYFLDADDLSSVATVAVTLELADGSTDSFDMSTTLATLVTNIQTILLPATNTITKTNAEQKIFAELMPDQTSIRIFGETEKVGITMERALAAASTVMGVNNNTNQQFTFGAIQLQTTQDKGISVDLGQNGLANGLGLVQANVSGADFDENFASASSTGSALSSMDVTTVANATGAITMIDNAIESVSKASSNLGAVQNRLNHVAMNVQETIVNTEAAQSRILDADYAVESARLAKQQVLQQAASAMLAQANASAQSVLTLLGA
jgi:flagellin